MMFGGSFVNYEIMLRYESSDPTLVCGPLLMHDSVNMGLFISNISF